MPSKSSPPGTWTPARDRISQIEAEARDRMEQYSQKKIAATCEKFIEKLEKLLPALEASTCHSINHGVSRVAQDAQKAAKNDLAAEIRDVAEGFRDELRQHVENTLAEAKKQIEAQARAAAETLAKKSESLREDLMRAVSADIDQKRRAAVDSITGEAAFEVEAHARHSLLAALSDIAGQLDHGDDGRQSVAGANDGSRGKRPAAANCASAG